MTIERRLLLFDIDGTLITSGGAGENALIDAMRVRFGVEEDLQGITLAGATDAAIARLLLRKHGLDDTPENQAALLDGYLHALSDRIGRHQGRVLPGIVELLEALRPREEVLLGLLTGNLRRGAEIKLRHYHVWDYFPFGAFADDHHDRNELGAFASQRARDFHEEGIPAERTYVLGDTPKDIACGKAFGAKTVAIATGNYSEDDLAAHEPDFLFRDLSDTAAVLDVLLGGSATRGRSTEICISS